MTATKSIDRSLAEMVAQVLIDVELSIPSRDGEPYTADHIRVDYLPRYEPADIAKEARILIAPRSRAMQSQSRTQQRREHVVQVCLLQQCKPNSDLQLELIDLMADIDDTLAKVHTLTGITGFRYATWQSSTCALYEPDDLEKSGIFRSVLTVNYLLHQ
jgi:hypothetical protein